MPAAFLPPSGRFYITGGSLHPDAPSYVERQADRELYDALLRREYCRVLATRQMGKSSLVVRTAARLREAGTAVAVLDIAAFGQHLSPEQWYGGLLRRFGFQLDPTGDLAGDLEHFRQDQVDLGPIQRWVGLLERVVLPRLAREEASLVIFLDEIDAVRSLPFSTDEFFAGIRECYDRRSQDPSLELLTFCLLSVDAPVARFEKLGCFPLREAALSPLRISRRPSRLSSHRG